jgi:hypothetical protein
MAVLLISAYAVLGVVMLVVIVRDQFGRGRFHSPYQDQGGGGPDGDSWHNGGGDCGDGGGDGGGGD